MKQIAACLTMLGYFVFSRPVNGNHGIYLAKADGSDVKRLTTDTAYDLVPSISPDGKRIAFASDRDLDYQIYTINPDGTDPMRITKTKGYQLSTGWQPQSNK